MPISPLLTLPAPTQQNANVVKASRLKRTAYDLYVTVFQGWARGMRDIWEAQDPQAVIDALGTDAVELFALSAKTVAFLESLNPGCTAEFLAKMKPFTENADGTISINPVTP